MNIVNKTPVLIAQKKTMLSGIFAIGQSIGQKKYVQCQSNESSRVRT